MIFKVHHHSTIHDKDGIRTREAYALELESNPFDRLGTLPEVLNLRVKTNHKLSGGLEPPIFSLQVRCLTNLAIRAETYPLQI